MEVKELNEETEMEELTEARRTCRLGGSVVDQARPTLPWIISFVKYDYSTSISQVCLFVRTILQGEENKGVELTGGGRGNYKAKTRNWKLGERAKGAGHGENWKGGVRGGGGE